MQFSRRWLLTCGMALALDGCQRPETSRKNIRPKPAKWGEGFEGQRIADLGNGTFQNPIFSGDRPDPSIIKVGDTYYLTFSSFDAYPGLMIWSSRDLVNWQPVGPTLTKPIGSVWAPDLVVHNEKFYLYIPARTENYKSIYVIHADRIEGPWSDPVDLFLPDHIDPGHIVGEDGKRYLFLSNGDRVQLTDDGLATASPVEHVYDPWRYPEDWDVECFCPEGPKMLRKGEWFYMLTAVGGTAGPPTGHMVIAARSHSIHGPWEHAPNNPQIRTESRDEAWWSRGHATLIEGPSGDWWIIYHGYEKDFWTLGRQCLLEPIRWRDDGWFEATGGDLSQPIRMPADLPDKAPHGIAYSDEFSDTSLHPKWKFYKPGSSETSRVNLTGNSLRLAGKGNRPANASPLCINVGDRTYMCEISIDRQPGNAAGLLLFYNDRLYCGLGFDDDGLMMHRYGQPRRRNDIPAGTKSLKIRATNDEHVVTFHYKLSGSDWQKFDVQMEVSGYHHNTAYDFLSLRPALYSTKNSFSEFREFKYQAFKSSALSTR